MSPTAISDATIKANIKEIHGLGHSQVIEGEMPVCNVDTSFITSKSIHKGRLVVTTYKVIFVPENDQLHLRMHLHPEYFNVPLGLIAKYYYIDAITIALRRL